eukprot:6021756-Pyramimonas_sp.AAC.2
MRAAAPLTTNNTLDHYNSANPAPSGEAICLNHPTVGFHRDNVVSGALSLAYRLVCWRLSR